MPRLAREVLGTSFFHVIVQGIAKEYIFKKEEYISRYLYLAKKYYKEHNIKILSYCIMNNHAHFMLYTEEIIEMSKAMQRINLVYSKYYNKENKRVGYVFRDRFLSEPITTDEQLTNCIVYIHQNPVKAKIATRMEKYKYSSYNDYIEKKGIIDDEIIKLVFGSTKNYIDQFKEMHKNESNECKDVYENNKDRNKKIVDNYLIKNEITIGDILRDKDTLKKFLINMRDKQNISNRALAEMLGINREKLRKIR